MAQETADANRKRSASGQRGATRAAVLDAARHVLTRDGAGAMSLEDVASEANLTPGALREHFRSKSELLISLMADDLTDMMRAMHDDIGAEPSAAAPDAVSGLIRKKGVMTPELEEILKQVAPQGGARPNGTSGAIARIERRLHVLEHALAGVEERLNEIERGRVNGASAAEAGIGTLGQRVETAEKHQQEAVEELRTAIATVAGRLQILEATPLAPLPSSGNVMGFQAIPERLEPALNETDWSQHPALPPKTLEPSAGEQPRAEQSPGTDSAGDYLATARRAANTASTAAVPAESGLTLAGRLGRLTAIVTDAWQHAKDRDRMRYLVIGSVVAALILLMAGFALTRAAGGPASAEITPPAQMAAPPPAAPAPSDRLRALANSGNAKAELILALNNLSGSGVAKNETAAAFWFARAANRGEALAQYWLGTLYARGIGVPADAGQAIQWYAMAANGGNRKAMHNLAVAYAEGQGVIKDFAQAAHWFAQAAALGFTESQYDLAVFYERGTGVPQSPRDAFRWYAIAAAQGDRQAEARTIALVQQLKTDDLIAAQQAADAFVPDPLNRAANVAPELADLPGG